MYSACIMYRYTLYIIHFMYIFIVTYCSLLLMISLWSVSLYIVIIYIAIVNFIFSPLCAVQNAQTYTVFDSLRTRLRWISMSRFVSKHSRTPVLHGRSKATDLLINLFIDAPKLFIGFDWSCVTDALPPGRWIVVTTYTLYKCRRGECWNGDGIYF